MSTPRSPQLATAGVPSPFDALRRIDSEHGEHWLARDIQAAMGYSRWETFEVPLHRAMKTAQNTGVDVTSNFHRSTKISATRSGVDYRLTRYAAYLVAMNGDPNKEQVARAQTYFAVKTREAETAVPAQRQPEVPSTFAEALRLAADKAEEAERLAVENAALKPAAHSWTELASAEGDYSVADAAKILDRDPVIRGAGGLGRKRLFDLLAELKWIHKGGDKRWHAYQRHVDLDRVAERARYFTDPDGVRQTATPQIRVTAKGIAELHRRLGGSEPVDYAAEDAPAVPSFPAHQMELTT